MQNQLPRAFKLSSLALLVTGACSSYAQQSDFNNEDKVLETITVTAQKRVQSIQDVPVTISAMDAQTMEDLGVARLDSLSDLVPGLVIQQQSINNNGYVIRGITSDDGSANGAARVSVYLNGTDVSRARTSYFEVYDMERVEVVKGPQATLFGTAASIGALSFITAKPEQEVSAKLKLAAGNFGMFETQGMVTGGNDSLQGRFAFVSKERDGYVENNAEHDLNGYDRLAYRASLRVTPNEDLTLDFIYSHDEADDPGTAFASRSVLFTDSGRFGVPDGNTLGMDDIGIDREVNDFNLSVAWDMGDSFTLNYIGAYRDHESLEVFDADGTEYQFLNFADDASGDQTSHELRLNYAGEKLNGFIGASYFAEDAKSVVPFYTEVGLLHSCLGTLAPFGVTECTPGITHALTGGALTESLYQSIFSSLRGDNSSASVFADASYLVNSNLELTAGIRFVKEDRKTEYMQDFPEAPLMTMLLGAPVPLTVLGQPVSPLNKQTVVAEEDDTVVLPRLNAVYTLDENTNIYATVGKGQRSQIVAFSNYQDTIVPAEKVNNFEIGIKGNNSESTLNYSASVFYQDYSNFQVTVFQDGIAIPKNVGEAGNTGFEGELSWSITDNLTLISNLALIDGTVDDSETNGEFAGNRFRLQPKTSGAISYIYNTQLTDNLNLFTSGSFSYRSSVFFDIENNHREDAVQLVNLRLGVSAADNNWDLVLSASNLFDKEYIMDAGNTGGNLGYPTYIEGAPRMVSLAFTKRFGSF